MHSKKKLMIVIGASLVIIGGGILGWLHWKKGNSTPQYTTEQATKGTLVNSVSASGTISSGNSYNVSTEVTGTIKKVYVKNGDQVTKGQKVAEIELDDAAKQKQSSLYASYLSTINSVDTAKQNKTQLESQILKDESSVAEAQNNVDQAHTDQEKNIANLQLEQAQKTLELDQNKYDNSDNSIETAQLQAKSALLNYQNYSSVITAPATGTINNFTIQEGSVIQSSSSSSNSNNSTSSNSSNTNSSSSSSSNSLGTIVVANNNLQAKINLTEADVIKVKVDQKATITIGAISEDKTYTGKVASIDTTGAVSSGVTTYSAIIIFDDNISNIYPNMNVDVQITTNVKDNVILVPSAAITTSNGQSTVQVLKNDTPETVNVEIGDSNDTQTEIKSGISEGDNIITKTTSNSTSTKQTTSVFSQTDLGKSNSNRNSGFGGAGMMMGR